MAHVKGSSGDGPLRLADEAGSQARHGSPYGTEERVLLTVVVLGSALAAALAPGHPTGIGPLDLAMKALLGAGCALAGVTTPWPFLAVSSVVVLAGTVRQPAIIPAAAALGISVGGWRGRWSARDATGSVRWAEGFGARSLRAAVGAVVAAVALRLSWPHVPLVPSAVATVAALLVLLPGVARAPRVVRRWIVRGCVVAGLAILGLTAVAAVAVLGARSSLQGGLNTVELGLHSAESGDQASARTDFATASQQFAAASRDLRWSRGAEIVPVVSQQVRAVSVAATIGQRLAAAALGTSATADVHSLRFVDGVFPVRTLEHLGPVLSSDVRVLQSALATTPAFGSPWIVSPLKAKLDVELAKLRRAEHDATVALLASKEVPGLLGAHGIRRYLVLFENPVESRASGGIVGDYAEITALDGRLHLVKVDGVAQLNKTGPAASKHLVGPADYLARYSQFQPQYNWQNVPMSPDFPSVGDVAAHLYPESGGQHVDGVISVDPVAMSGLLAATGPIHTPLWARPLTTGNIVEVLAHQEFLQFATSESSRGHFVRSVIKLLWHDLVSQPLPAVPQLANELKPALSNGHLLLYSTRSGEERFFQTVHVAGAMPAVRGDFLGVVSQNAAGNKLDWYLRRSIDYRATVDRASGRVSAALTVTLHNSSPTSGLPPVVLDPAAGVSTTPGENELYVSIYSPWQLTDSSLNGSAFVMADQEELGRFVYSGLVTVPAGGTTTLVLHLLGHWPRPGSPYHLSVLHQPVLFSDHVTTSLHTLR